MSGVSDDRNGDTPQMNNSRFNDTPQMNSTVGKVVITDWAAGNVLALLEVIKEIKCASRSRILQLDNSFFVS